MSKEIKVILNGKEVKTRSGTQIFELLKDHPHQGADEAIGAIVNNRLMGLYHRFRSNCTVRTIDYASKGGVNIYRRSVSLIMFEAFAELYPNIRLEIGQSLGDGYYFEVHTGNGSELTMEMIVEVERRMREIVDEDRSLQPSLVAREEAEDYFTEKEYPEKALLLRQRRVFEIPWVVTGKFRDTSYGPVAPSTSLCRRFSIIPQLPGFVLNFPDKSGQVLQQLPPQPKIFAAYKEAREWNEMLGAWNIGQLNQACIDGSVSDIIKISEGLQEKKIVRIADEITARKDDVKLVLIAGPSSSGKTTFTKRLAVQLQVNGIKPMMISLDNYYVNRVETPKNADGTYDFECLEALDVATFNHHLSDLLDGKKVETPIYDFQVGERRSDKNIPLQMDDKTVLIAEGIHGLNPKLTSAVSGSNKYKIYVSALTQLCIDEHNRIFTSDARLIRRIVRDRLFRGYSATQTINQWQHVRKGENEYIFPFQEEADAMFNTALVYEQAVLKPYMTRYLMEVPTSDPAHVEAYRMVQFLNLFIPIFSHEVPPNSILREFIGGSAFNY